MTDSSPIRSEDENIIPETSIDSKCSVSCEEKIMSKSQMKKLKKREKWLEKKSEKRKKEKVKLKAKRARAREQGESLGPSRKTLKKNSMANSACKVKVVVDCSFDEYMADRDAMKVVKQLQHCYSLNRRATDPLQFYVCGVDGKIRKKLDDIGDYKNWDIFLKDESYHKVFEQEKIVYLSSDSSNILEDLDPDKAYIIGGLVDHNHEKGLCHRLAEEKGVAHAQLPIGQYLNMKSRKILTVDHVFEILLRFTETKSWQKSFFAVIPQRKGAMIKDSIDHISTQTDNANNDNADSKEADEEPEQGVKPEVIPMRCYQS